jgi:protein CpxP
LKVSPGLPAGVLALAKPSFSPVFANSFGVAGVFFCLKRICYKLKQFVTAQKGFPPRIHVSYFHYKQRKFRSMIMKIALISIGLVIAAVGIVGASSGFCDKRGNPEEFANHMVEKITKKLSLREDQVAKLEIAKTELLSIKKDMSAQRQTMRTSFIDLIEKPTLDQQTILSMVKEKTQSVNDKAPQVVVALAGFYDSLNPEQQEMLREKIKDKMESHRSRWSHN